MSRRLATGQAYRTTYEQRRESGNKSTFLDSGQIRCALKYQRSSVDQLRTTAAALS